MVVEVGLAPEIVTSGRADKIERCQRKNSLDSGLVNEWDGEIGERAKNVETLSSLCPIVVAKGIKPKRDVPDGIIQDSGWRSASTE